MSYILKIFLLFCIVNLIQFADAYFLRGKRFRKLNPDLKVTNISDQYYDQRLDHFNEALKTTWKQVIRNLKKFDILKLIVPISLKSNYDI